MEFLQRGTAAKENVDNLIRSGISPVLAELLCKRGVQTPQQAQAFLNPDVDGLCDPFAMQGMDRAVQRIRRAVEENERIVVYGDYDCDGVSAVSVLMSYFQSVGAQASYYIPARHEEGYGLNKAAVKKLAGECSLLITVDCGIASMNEVALANEYGLDVIVSDHHQLKDELPQAVAVLNPLLGDYPCRTLCGAGVALKIVQALGGVEAAMERMDLAALGTVADIVELLGENRVIASLGIRKMNRALRPGLAALAKCAGLEGRQIDAGHIGYLIGPRINAGGRIDRSDKSVELLLTGNHDTAQEIAMELEQNNALRQALERDITQQCLKLIETQVDFSKNRAIILCGEGWNQGVVGIVASRLTEKYAMPCLLFAKQDGVLTGSGRSVKGVHLVQAIASQSALLVRFGGHEMAAGLTLREEDFEAFCRGFERYLWENTPAQAYESKQYYDMTLLPGQIRTELCRELEALSPCGIGNPTPCFLLPGVHAKKVKTMGQDGRHVRLTLEKDGGEVAGVGFSMADRQEMLQSGQALDALVQLNLNQWNGKTTAQALLRRVAPCKEDQAAFFEDNREQIVRDFFQELLYNKNGFDYDGSPHAASSHPDRLGRGDLALVADPKQVDWDALASTPAYVGHPAGEGAFACVVVAPKIDRPFVGYRRIFLLDRGVWALAGEIERQNPLAQIVFTEPKKSSFPPLFTREDLGALYPLLVRHQGPLGACASFQEAAQMVRSWMGMEAYAFSLALLVFEELGFLQTGFSPWRLSMRKNPEKRELGQSFLYRLAQEGALT